MTYQTSQNFIRIMNLLVTLYSIKVGFLSICRITAGCHSNNQLLFTAFCLLSVGWIKANGESSLPILFCPLTVDQGRTAIKKQMSQLTALNETKWHLRTWHSVCVLRQSQRQRNKDQNNWDIWKKGILHFTNQLHIYTDAWSSMPIKSFFHW